ncbi:MAG TPA: glucose-6-phosphate dehydrogenase assembly protein OpcA [Opitutaceae bacterium]
MPAVFNALPGIEVPVGAIAKSLSGMWEAAAAQGGPAPAADDVKATQINLVLHFGFATQPDEARAQFDTALRFSKRYPSRVVVLCPLARDQEATEMRAKIYGECFLGKSKGDTRCVEFVMLSYPLSARQHLESQVSICLSTDLPLYYWAHRFSSSARLNDYQYLLRRSKRVMFDSAIVPGDALTFPWPRPEAVRDLAHARLLPVRQSLGQFLSGFKPAMLVDGLQAVTVLHASTVSAEGRVLLEWLRTRLQECGAAESLRLEAKPFPTGGKGSFDVAFTYANSQRFHWRGDIVHGSSHFHAFYGCEQFEMPGSVHLLSPEAALAEAMFF